MDIPERFYNETIVDKIYKKDKFVLIIMFNYLHIIIVFVSANLYGTS